MISLVQVDLYTVFSDLKDPGQKKPGQTSGNKKRTYKIIESLKSEGMQPTRILWALTKEINNLYKVMEEKSTKNIWGPRHYLEALNKRVNQLTKSKLKQSLLEVAEIDASIKGLSSKNPWQAIRDLAINF